MEDPFRNIAADYTNIISEATARLEIVERALSKGLPADNLDYVALSDLCALQFRKIFEAIALACIAGHGDLPIGKRIKNDAYRADKLLTALERLHADFYPKPCRVLERGLRGIKIRDIENDCLTKDRLKKLYFLFDHEMHVGSLTRREKGPSVISFESYELILSQTRALIFTHWLWLANGERILCEAGQDKEIEITLLHGK